MQFCNRQGWDPLHLRPNDICIYFIHLYDRGLMPSTIRVHKAAIQSVLKHLGSTLFEEAVVHDLFNSFDRARPRPSRVLPKFDFEVVLRGFLRPPFVDNSGSDRGIPLELFVMKTTFLLALATGCRAGELHALSRKHKFAVDTLGSGKRVMTLHAYPGFLAKNQKAGDMFRPLEVPSMCHLVGPRDPDRLWCPVRAVIIYLGKTNLPAYDAQDYRILRHPDPTKKTKKGNISLWIRLAIAKTHQSADIPLDHINAHEVRAVATSLLAASGAPMKDVLDSGRWRSEDSFFNHYLREVASSSGSFNAPFVAAGHVL